MSENLEKLHRECEFFLIAGKHKEALQKYEEISKVSCDPFIWAARAKLLENLHREEEAVEIFEKAVRMNQNSGKARIEMIRLILDVREDETSILKKLAQKSLDVLESDEALCKTLCVFDQQKEKQTDKSLSDKRDESWDQEKTVLNIQDKKDESWDQEKTVLNTQEQNAHVSTLIEDLLPLQQQENKESLQDFSSDIFHAVDKTQVVGSDISPSLAEHVSKIDTELPFFSASLDKEKESIAGSRFGRYKIIKKLGEGGMGIVYKVYDSQVDRVVALKVVRSDTVSTPEQAARFLQEVKATARLEHSGIVRIYDFGNEPQYYFTMEYITGKTLSDLIHEEIFRCKKAAKILKSICSAIACAHKAKIIHRDLKPSNIMVDDEGNIKVMDFGLAKIEGERSLSRTGDILGTPVYMPPEQASGQKNDYRSDIYSLGAIGYEMITGKPIFKGENVFNILHQVANVDPVRPQSINANIDIELDTILLKCLEKSPEKRYQSVEELDEELSRYLEDRPILAKPPDTVARIKKWIKRHKELTAAIFTIVLAIFAGFGVLIWMIFTTRALSINSDMAANIMRWNMKELSYEKDVKPVFEKRLTRCNLFYRYWAEFFFRYSEYHPAEQEKCYKEAEQKLQLAILDNPKEFVSLYYLGMIYRAWGKMEESERYFERLIDIAYNDIDKDGNIKEDAIKNEFHYVAIAIKAVFSLHKVEGKENIKKEIEKTIKILKESTRYNGNLFCSYNGTGELYQRLANFAREDGNFTLEEYYFQEAEKYYTYSLQAGPTYVLAYWNRSNLLFEKAQKAIQKNEPEEMVNLYIQKAWKDLQTARTIQLKSIHTKNIYYSSLRLQLLLQQKAEIQSLLKSKENTFTEEILKELEKDKAIDVFLKNPQYAKSIEKVWNYIKKSRL